MIWFGRILAVLLVLVLAGWSYEPLAKALLPPEQMADVGGYRLYFNCSGSGSPTVVIETGLG